MPKYQGVEVGPGRPPMPADVLARFFGDADTPPEAAGTPPSAIAFPPHYFPPPYGAERLYRLATLTVAGPNVNWAVPADIEAQLQPSEVAVIRNVGFSVTNMLATTNVQVTLRVGRAPLAPVYRIPPQGAGYVERVWDGAAYVTRPGVLIDMMVTVVDGGSYPISAYYDGWTMPAVALARYLGFA